MHTAGRWYRQTGQDYFGVRQPFKHLNDNVILRKVVTVKIKSKTELHPSCTVGGVTCWVRLNVNNNSTNKLFMSLPVFSELQLISGS